MRLIDADELLAEILHDIETSGCVNHERDMLDSIRCAPTIDAVPVVRCAECIHSREIEKVPANRYFTDRVKRCTELRGSASDDGISAVWRDGYCDDGQRKEDAK